MTTRANRLLPSSLRAATRPVYHYTTAEGLLGIVESRCLRASEASGLNDLAEIRQGWKLIERWVDRQASSPEVDRLKGFAADPLQDKHELFVLSGSTAGDDANQWRLYAQEGRGYAIELRSDAKLAAVSSELAAPTSTRTIGWLMPDAVSVTPWFHVLYEEPEAHKVLRELVRNMKAEAKRIARVAKSAADADELYTDLRDDSYEALATIAHLIKAPGFRGENEVRIVTAFVWGKRHVQYRPGAHGIVGFAELTAAPKGHLSGSVIVANKPPRPRGHSLPLRSVRLGPLVMSEEHEQTVRAFLNKHDLRRVLVSSSSVLLR